MFDIRNHKNEFIKLNLQFFAESAKEDDTNENEEDEKEVDLNKETFTKDEVIRLIQSESDKRVTQAIEKINKKHQRQLETQRTLSKLDEEDRNIAEKDIRIKELEEQLENSKIQNTKAEIAKVLAKRNLSVDLVDFVVTSADETECLNKINVLENVYKEMVKKGVEERLKGYGGNFKGGSGTEYSGINKEQFNKMSLSERNELYTKNKELYLELMKG